MKRKYLAFDIETVKLVPLEASDWRLCRPLGISCAATLATGQDAPTVWHGGRNAKHPTSRMQRGQLCKMVRYLEGVVEDGHTIVTWNGIGFDFDVLAEESGLVEACKRLVRSHVDMMFHILCQLGYCISLSAAAKGMGLAGKSQGMTGLDAPRLWAKEQRHKVLQYVAQDVQTTLALAKRCECERVLRWVAQSGRRRQIALPKGWLTVSSAQKLPEPVTFWMTSPLPRQRFTAWLR